MFILLKQTFTQLTIVAVNCPSLPGSPPGFSPPLQPIIKTTTNRRGATPWKPHEGMRSFHHSEGTGLQDQQGD
ncbi:MAG: hypothetical protein F4206_14520 [Gammaproteobacteria bacterium]|nr:hypothetical protein [Gammaproteobacteria bacterium]